MAFEKSFASLSWRVHKSLELHQVRVRTILDDFRSSPLDQLPDWCYNSFDSRGTLAKAWLPLINPRSADHEAGIRPGGLKCS
jgi:hypothetical protein